MIVYFYFTTDLIVPDVPGQPLVEELKVLPEEFDSQTKSPILFDLQLYRSSDEMAPVL